jgi:hypothetical protein
VAKKKLRDLKIQVASCNSLMTYAPAAELEDLNLKAKQWVTVVGQPECGKPHVAYITNYDKDLDLWFFMVEREPVQ